MSRRIPLYLDPPTLTAPPETLACELDVLSHWYGDTPELLAQAYGDYLAEQTVFITVRQAMTGQVVGFARLIRPGRRPLKTLLDIGRPPWSVDPDAAVRAAGIDPGRSWDIATLGVRPELGSAGAMVAATVYYANAATMLANGGAWAIAIVDRRVRAVLRWSGLDMLAIPGTGPAEYMGSPACLPAYGRVHRTLDRRLRQELLARCAAEAGTERGPTAGQVLLPPPDTFALTDLVPDAAG